MTDKTDKQIKSNRDWLKIGIVAALCVAAVMLIAYFGSFWYRHGFTGFSDKPSDWGYFGSYFAAITGLLAFLAALWNIRQSQRSAKVNEERDIFYQLLKIHTGIVERIKYKSEDGKEYIGEEFFEYLVRDFHFHLSANHLYYSLREQKGWTNEHKVWGEKGSILHPDIQSIIEKLSPGKEEFGTIQEIIFPTTRKLWKKWNKVAETYVYGDDEYEEWLNDESYYEAVEIRELAQKLKALNIVLPDFVLSRYVFVKGRKYDFELLEACQTVIDNYKYALGKYFRHVKYLLEEIKGFTNGSKYADIFATQISRYESVVLFMNLMGSNIYEKDSVMLFADAGLFNDFYLIDIFLDDNVYLYPEQYIRRKLEEKFQEIKIDTEYPESEEKQNNTPY